MSFSRHPLFFVLPILMFFGGAVVADDGKRSLTAEDVLNITWAVRPEVSPDGSQVVYSVIETKDGKRQTTHWLSATTGGASPQQVLAEFSGVSHIRWSRNGRMLAFLAVNKDSGAGKQLFVGLADGTNPRRISAMPNGVSDYRWSADSTTIGFLADERPQESTNIVVAGHERLPRTALWTIDIDGGEPERISSDDQHVIDFAWSPDGASFATLIETSQRVDVPSTSLIIQRRGDGATVRSPREERNRWMRPRMVAGRQARRSGSSLSPQTISPPGFIRGRRWRAAVPVCRLSCHSHRSNRMGGGFSPLVRPLRGEDSESTRSA